MIESKIKKAPPMTHENNKTKKSGIIFVSKDAKNDVIAALGNIIKSCMARGFNKFNFIFALRFIIMMFKREDMSVLAPIPTAKAFIPIKTGKNHMQTKRAIAPKK